MRRRSSPERRASPPNRSPKGSSPPIIALNQVVTGSAHLKKCIYRDPRPGAKQAAAKEHPKKRGRTTEAAPPARPVAATTPSNPESPDVSLEEVQVEATRKPDPPAPKRVPSILRRIQPKRGVISTPAMRQLRILVKPLALRAAPETPAPVSAPPLSTPTTTTALSPSTSSPPSAASPAAPPLSTPITTTVPSTSSPPSAASLVDPPTAPTAFATSQPLIVLPPVPSEEAPVICLSSDEEESPRASPSPPIGTKQLPPVLKQDTSQLNEDIIAGSVDMLAIASKSSSQPPSQARCSQLTRSGSLQLARPPAVPVSVADGVLAEEIMSGARGVLTVHPSRSIDPPPTAEMKPAEGSQTSQMAASRLIQLEAPSLVSQTPSQLDSEIVAGARDMFPTASELSSQLPLACLPPPETAGQVAKTEPARSAPEARDHQARPCRPSLPTAAGSAQLRGGQGQREEARDATRDRRKPGEGQRNAWIATGDSQASCHGLQVDRETGRGLPTRALGGGECDTASGAGWRPQLRHLRCSPAIRELRGGWRGAGEPPRPDALGRSCAGSLSRVQSEPLLVLQSSSLPRRASDHCSASDQGLSVEFIHRASSSPGPRAQIWLVLVVFGFPDSIHGVVFGFPGVSPPLFADLRVRTNCGCNCRS